MPQKKKSKNITKKKISPRKPKLSLRKPKIAAKKKPARKVAGISILQKEDVFERSENNPILEPIAKSHWESKATFNPAALYANGKVHLLYRAIGDNDVSVLGYAVSKTGEDITLRSPHPAYARKFKKLSRAAAMLYGSGGGWNGGTEDPRLALIGDTVYMIHTAFDGWGSVRMALATISKEDFLNRRWRWKKEVFISPPGEIHKNWVLFPGKINGRFALLTSVSPEIKISYFDSVDELDDHPIRSSYARGKANLKRWDNWVRGAGPTPIKTADGWLILYHAMDDNDPNRYKIGAMLLDLKDPTKILYRSKTPILEPDEIYENEGFKPGVVYCCGAVVVKGDLIIYYGGADKFVCAARTDLSAFLKDLKATGKPELKTLKNPRLNKDA